MYTLDEKELKYLKYNKKTNSYDTITKAESESYDKKFDEQAEKTFKANRDRFENKVAAAVKKALASSEQPTKR